MRGEVCVCVCGLPAGSRQLGSQTKAAEMSRLPNTTSASRQMFFQPFTRWKSLFRARTFASNTFRLIHVVSHLGCGISPAVGQVFKTHFSPTLSLRKSGLSHTGAGFLVKKTSAFFRSFAFKSLTSLTWNPPANHCCNPSEQTQVEQVLLVGPLQA